MKLKSKTAPIHHPQDDAELKQQIDELVAKRFKVTRPHFHQIKVGIFNYFWSTERITIDPCQTHPERGFDAFLELIERRVKRRAQDGEIVFPLPVQML